MQKYDICHKNANRLGHQKFCQNKNILMFFKKSIYLYKLIIGKIFFIENTIKNF